MITRVESSLSQHRIESKILERPFRGGGSSMAIACYWKPSTAWRLSISSLSERDRETFSCIARRSFGIALEMAVALFRSRRVTHQSGRMILEVLVKSGQRLIGRDVTPLPSAAATRVVPRYSVCGPRCRDRV